MTDLLSLLGVSFLLGMRHATDPDHLVAVAAIVARHATARAALAVGALWGVGHTLMVFAVGGAIVLFGVTVPPRMGLFLELGVAGMLIALGAVNLAGALGNREPSAHGHAGSSSPPRASTLFAAARPLAVGMVHGVAGSAAVALLVVATAHSTSSALGYLVVFGVGTLLGMTLLTGLMVRPLARTRAWSREHKTLFVRATGLLSVGFGVFLAYRVGVTDGLFAAIQ